MGFFFYLFNFWVFDELLIAILGLVSKLFSEPQAIRTWSSLWAGAVLVVLD